MLGMLYAVEQAVAAEAAKQADFVRRALEKAVKDNPPQPSTTTDIVSYVT